MSISWQEQQKYKKMKKTFDIWKYRMYSVYQMLEKLVRHTITLTMEKNNYGN